MDKYTIETGLYYHTQKDGKKQSLLAWCLPYSFAESAILGYWFGIIEIYQSDSFWANQQIIKIAAELNENFNDFLQEGLSLEKNLETLLNKINSEIESVITQKSLPIEGEKINALLGIIENNSLGFCQIGNIGAYLAHNGPEKEGQIINIIEKTPAGNRIYPLKMFNNLFLGRISSHDLLFFCNENVLNYLSLNKIQQMVCLGSANASAQHFSEVLESINARTDYATLTIKLSLASEPTTLFSAPVIAKKPVAMVINQAQNKNIFSSQESIDRLLQTQDATADILTPALKPLLKKLGQKVSQIITAKYVNLKNTAAQAATRQKMKVLSSLNKMIDNIKLPAKPERQKIEFELEKSTTDNLEGNLEPLTEIIAEKIDAPTQTKTESLEIAQEITKEPILPIPEKVIFTEEASAEDAAQDENMAEKLPLTEILPLESSEAIEETSEIYEAKKAFAWPQFNWPTIPWFKIKLTFQSIKEKQKDLWSQCRIKIQKLIYRRQISGSLLEKSNDLLNRLLARWQEIPSGSKKILLAFFAILFIFLQSLVWQGAIKNSANQQKQFAEKLAAFQAYLNKTNVQLAANDEAGAQQNLLQAQNIFSAIKPLNANQLKILGEAKLDWQKQQTKVNKLIIVENPQLIIDFQQALGISNLTNFTKIDKYLFAFDNNNKQLLRFSLLDKTTETYPLAQVDGPVLNLKIFSAKLLYLQTAKALYEFNLDKKTIAATNLELPNNTVIKDFEFFNQRLYLLLPEAGQVVRYGKSGTNFLTGQSIVNQPVLTSAVSLAIDSSIYIAKANGQILKYTAGKNQPFALPKLSPALISAQKIFSAVDIDWVYLLDNQDSRLLVMDKTGSLKMQYQLPNLKNLSDLVISPAEHAAYILASGKIYSFDITL